MIAFDTNLLVRFIMEDDPQQTATVARAIRSAIKEGERIFIPAIVLCELVWVLSFAYRLIRQDISTAIDQLLLADHLDIETPDAAARAAVAYRSGRGDFADYLIAEAATRAGCQRVLTFDKDLWSDPRFMSPSRWLR